MVGISSSSHFLSKIVDSLVSFKASLLGSEVEKIKFNIPNGLNESSEARRIPSCVVAVIAALSSTGLSTMTKDSAETMSMKETKGMSRGSGNLLGSKGGRASKDGGGVNYQHPSHSKGGFSSSPDYPVRHGNISEKGRLPQYAQIGMASVNPLPYSGISHPSGSGGEGGGYSNVAPQYQKNGAPQYQNPQASGGGSDLDPNLKNDVGPIESPVIPGGPVDFKVEPRAQVSVGPIENPAIPGAPVDFKVEPRAQVAVGPLLVDVPKIRIPGEPLKQPAEPILVGVDKVKVQPVGVPPIQAPAPTTLVGVPPIQAPVLGEPLKQPAEPILAGVDKVKVQPSKLVGVPPIQAAVLGKPLEQPAEPILAGVDKVKVQPSKLVGVPPIQAPVLGNPLEQPAEPILAGVDKVKVQPVGVPPIQAPAPTTLVGVPSIKAPVLGKPLEQPAEPILEGVDKVKVQPSTLVGVPSIKAPVLGEPLKQPAEPILAGVDKVKVQPSTLVGVPSIKAPVLGEPLKQPAEPILAGVDKVKVQPSTLVGVPPIQAPVLGKPLEQPAEPILAGVDKVKVQPSTLVGVPPIQAPVLGEPLEQPAEPILEGVDKVKVQPSTLVGVPPIQAPVLGEPLKQPAEPILAGVDKVKVQPTTLVGVPPIQAPVLGEPLEAEALTTNQFIEPDLHQNIPFVPVLRDLVKPSVLDNKEIPLKVNPRKVEGLVDKTMPIAGKELSFPDAMPIVIEEVLEPQNLPPITIRKHQDLAFAKAQVQTIEEEILPTIMLNPKPIVIEATLGAMEPVDLPKVIRDPGVVFNARLRDLDVGRGDVPSDDNKPRRGDEFIDLPDENPIPLAHVLGEPVTTEETVNKDVSTSALLPAQPELGEVSVAPVRQKLNPVRLFAVDPNPAVSGVARSIPVDEGAPNLLGGAKDVVDALEGIYQPNAPKQAAAPQAQMDGAKLLWSEEPSDKADKLGFNPQAINVPATKTLQDLLNTAADMATALKGMTQVIDEDLDKRADEQSFIDAGHAGKLAPMQSPIKGKLHSLKLSSGLGDSMKKPVFSLDTLAIAQGIQEDRLESAGKATAVSGQLIDKVKPEEAAAEIPGGAGGVGKIQKLSPERELGAAKLFPQAEPAVAQADYSDLPGIFAEFRQKNQDMLESLVATNSFTPENLETIAAQFRQDEHKLFTDLLEQLGQTFSDTEQEQIENYGQALRNADTIEEIEQIFNSIRNVTADERSETFANLMNVNALELEGNFFVLPSGENIFFYSVQNNDGIIAGLPVPGAPAMTLRFIELSDDMLVGKGLVSGDKMTVNVTLSDTFSDDAVRGMTPARAASPQTMEELENQFNAAPPMPRGISTPELQDIFSEAPNLSINGPAVSTADLDQALADMAVPQTPAQMDFIDPAHVTETPQSLRDRGYRDDVVLAADYPANELFDAGFNVEEVANAGYSPEELSDAGVTLLQLVDVGFSADELEAIGFNRPDIQFAQFRVHQAGLFPDEADLYMDPINGFTDADLHDEAQAQGWLPAAQQAVQLVDDEVTQFRNRLAMAYPDDADLFLNADDVTDEEILQQARDEGWLAAAAPIVVQVPTDDENRNAIEAFKQTLENDPDLALTVWNQYRADAFAALRAGLDTEGILNDADEYFANGRADLLQDIQEYQTQLDQVNAYKRTLENDPDLALTVWNQYRADAFAALRAGLDTEGILNDADEYFANGRADLLQDIQEYQTQLDQVNAYKRTLANDPDLALTVWNQYRADAFAALRAGLDTEGILNDANEYFANGRANLLQDLQEYQTQLDQVNAYKRTLANDPDLALTVWNQYKADAFAALRAGLDTEGILNDANEYFANGRANILQEYQSTVDLEQQLAMGAPLTTAPLSDAEFTTLKGFIDLNLSMEELEGLGYTTDQIKGAKLQVLSDDDLEKLLSPAGAPVSAVTTPQTMEELENQFKAAHPMPRGVQPIEADLYSNVPLGAAGPAVSAADLDQALAAMKADFSDDAIKDQQQKVKALRPALTNLDMKNTLDAAEDQYKAALRTGNKTEQRKIRAHIETTHGLGIDAAEYLLDNYILDAVKKEPEANRAIILKAAYEEEYLHTGSSEMANRIIGKVRTLFGDEEGDKLGLKYKAQAVAKEEELKTAKVPTSARAKMTPTQQAPAAAEIAKPKKALKQPLPLSSRAKDPDDK